MNRDQNTRYHSLRKRCDVLLATSLILLTNDAARSLLAATNANDVEVALDDAEFFIRRMKDGREQVAGIYREAVVACRTV